VNSPLRNYLARCHVNEFLIHIVTRTIEPTTNRAFTAAPFNPEIQKKREN